MYAAHEIPQFDTEIAQKGHFRMENSSIKGESMTSTNDRVVEEALSLPSDVRISLVEKLLTSLNLPVDEEVDRLHSGHQQ